MAAISVERVERIRRLVQRTEAIYVGLARYRRTRPVGPESGQIPLAVVTSPDPLTLRISRSVGFVVDGRAPRQGRLTVRLGRWEQGILARWRAIELQLEALDPMTAEADELKVESYRQRNEYEDLIDEAIARDRPAPPPWPALGGRDHGSRPPMFLGGADR